MKRCGPRSKWNRSRRLTLVAAVIVGGCSSGGSASLDSTALDGTATDPPSTATAAATTTTLPTSTSAPREIDATCDVALQPGDDLQAVVDATAPGTTFCLADGTYRNQQVHPSSGSTFVGGPNAVMSGATLLEGWTEAAPGRWSIGGQTQEGYGSGYCADGRPRCIRPEDLFVDDVRIEPAASLAELDADSWYFDYESDTIFLGRDPVGHVVETSVTTSAFYGAADDVTLAGFTIEKYASPAQAGAIDAGEPDQETARGWHLSDMTVRWNHGAGLAVRQHDGLFVDRSKFLENGQIGIVGEGDDIVIRDSEIVGNNTAGFDFEWEAGGTKFSDTDHLVIAGNVVRDNVGPGLWTDTDNIDTTYEDNVVTNNAAAGIFHEISYDAVIRDNVVSANGTGLPDEWCYGAGIQVSASSGVVVVDNVVEGNRHSITGIAQDREGGKYGPLELRGLTVRRNRISGGDAGGSLVGVCRDNDDSVFTTEWQNTFDDNTYSGTLNSWTWNDQYVGSFAEWQALGQEPNGRTLPG